jgi:hypothetical protein
MAYTLRKEGLPTEAIAGEWAAQARKDSMVDPEMRVRGWTRLRMLSRSSVATARLGQAELS